METKNDQTPVQQVEQPEQPAPTPGTVLTSADTVPPVIPGTETTSQGSGVDQAKKPRNKWVTFMMVLGILLATGGAAAAAYLGFYLPRQPENILARAIGNTLSENTVTSGRSEGTVSIENNQTKKTASIAYKGASNGSDNELSIDVNAGDTNIAGTFRRIDPNLYFRVDGLHKFKDALAFIGQDNGYVAAYQSMLDSTNDKWVTLPQKDTEQLDTRQMVETETISAEDAQAVVNAYRKNTFLKVTKVFDDQQIHNATSHHYQVMIDKQKLQDFLKEIKSQDIEGLPNFTDDDIEWIGKSDINKVQFEVWIDKSLNIVNQISFRWTMGRYDVDVRSALYDVNQDITISKPDGAKTFQQLLGDNLETLIFGNMSEELDGAQR